MQGGRSVCWQLGYVCCTPGCPAVRALPLCSPCLEWWSDCQQSRGKGMRNNAQSMPRHHNKRGQLHGPMQCWQAAQPSCLFGAPWPALAASCLSGYQSQLCHSCVHVPMQRRATARLVFSSQSNECVGGYLCGGTARGCPLIFTQAGRCMLAAHNQQAHQPRICDYDCICPLSF